MLVYGLHMTSPLADVGRLRISGLEACLGRVSTVAVARLALPKEIVYTRSRDDPRSMRIVSRREPAREIERV